MKKTNYNLHDAKKYVNKFKKVNKFKLSLFISDVVVFLVVFIGFFYEILRSEKMSDQSTIITVITYVTLILCFYILLKFTVTNFFYSNVYFESTEVFNKTIVIKNVKIQKNEIINNNPFWFLTLLILINIFATIVINYQSSVIFSNQKVIAACIDTLSSILLIPSFSTILNKITEIKKPIINNYTNLIKKQFINFKDLFENIENENNYEYIKFSDISLQSKKGLFLVKTQKEFEEEIDQFNNEIIEIYKDIWEQYYNFLEWTNSVSRRNKLSFYIERKFDQIFVNFIEF